MCGLFQHHFIQKVKAIFAIQLVHLYGVFSVTARYVFHMLKLQCHLCFFDNFYNLNVWTVPALLYLKVRAIFALPYSCMYSIFL